MGFQGVLARRSTDIYEAPWGNGCGRVAPASALGFGSVCGMGQVRPILRSDRGGSTPNMVRSASPRCYIHPPEFLVWVGWNRLGLLIWVGDRLSLPVQRLPSRSPLLPCGAPCRARLDLVVHLVLILTNIVVEITSLLLRGLNGVADN